MTAEKKEVLLSVRDLQVVFGERKNRFVAVDGVSFDIYRGETFGLVGESGSGKTTIGRAIIRVNPITKGEVLYKGERISGRISTIAWVNLPNSLLMIKPSAIGIITISTMLVNISTMLTVTVSWAYK